VPGKTGTVAKKAEETHLRTSMGLLKKDHAKPRVKRKRKKEKTGKKKENRMSKQAFHLLSHHCFGRG